MSVEFYSVGGFEEVGRNMSAVKVDDEIVVLDMGWDLSKMLLLPRNKDWRNITTQELIERDVFPNDEQLLKQKSKVLAIIASHAHLDHISAIPRMAPPYTCPIIGTPFTIEVIKTQLDTAIGPFSNKFIKLNAGSTYPLSDNITLEFVNITHSTLQCAIPVLHTPYGTVIYANDWKFDNTPIIGQKTDTKRIRKLGSSGDVLALISCCLNMEKQQKTYSESVVVDMLKDVLFNVDNTNNAIIATTFASNIGRLKTLIELSKKMGRTPILLGSSLYKYVKAAENCKLIKFTKDIDVIGSSLEVKKKLKEISDNGREEYLIITTGHQGEEDSVLDKMSHKELPFALMPGDQIIFSSNVIPSPVNVSNRAELENRLRRFKVRIFKDVHVSGHASKEDHRDMIAMVNPKNYIPCHGEVEKLANAISLAYDFNMKLGKDAHILQNGQVLPLS